MSIDNELNLIKNEPQIGKMRDAIHDGIKKGYDKSVTAESYAAEVKDNYDAVLLQWDSDPNKDPELVTARDGEPTLNDRLDRDKTEYNAELTDVNAQLAQKASHTEVDEKVSKIVSGSPKGVFDTLTDLETTLPDGDNGVYLVKENGNWYYWENSTWTLGGTYQSDPDGRVDFIEDELNLNYNQYTIKNGIANSDFGNGTTNFGSGSTLEIVNGKLKATKNTTDTVVNVGVNTDLPYKSGHKYYTSVKVTPLSAVNTLSLVLYPRPSLSWSDYIASVSNLTANQEVNLTSYIDGTLTDTTSDTMFFHIRGEYTSGNADSFLVYQPMMFDLTEIYGVGNEPTQEEFEKKISNNYGEFIIRLADDFIKTTQSKVDVIKNRFVGKKIASFGDSITMNIYEGTRYTDILSDQLGATVYNVGFAGCRMSNHPQTEYDAFSMYRLADAIVSGDWSLQDASVSIEPEYAEQLATLKSIDFNTLDYLTIAYGTNDWWADKELYNAANNDLMNTWDYISSGRYSLDKILTAYPNIRIILITPIWRYIDATTNGDNRTNGAGLYLYQFADGLMDLAEEFRIPAIDVYHTLGINNYTHALYLHDGVHPTGLGSERLGGKIASFINGEF